MVVTLLCVAAIVVALGFAAHYIDSAYEDFKEYMNTQNKYNDRQLPINLLMVNAYKLIFRDCQKTFSPKMDNKSRAYTYF